MFLLCYSQRLKIKIKITIKDRFLTLQSYESILSTFACSKELGQIV